MNRREFLRRSAPLIASGAVSPLFVDVLFRKLFGYRKYWIFGNDEESEVIVPKWAISEWGEYKGYVRIINPSSTDPLIRISKGTITGRFIGNKHSCP